jgi:diguanylate cyclase (GGDEF)-like protein
MLAGRASGDAESMKRTASPRAARPAMRERDRTSAQIRRFALFWGVASLGVLLSVAAASVVASHYREDAGRRARATTDAELAVARLQAQVQNQAANVLSFRATGEAVYRQQFLADRRRVRTALSTLRGATIDAGNHRGDRQLLGRTADDITSWENAAALETAQRPGGHGGLSPTADPAPNSQVADITGQLGMLESSLTAESADAVSAIRSHAHIADVIRQVSILLGLIILFAGGVRLLRRAFTLAAAADAHREREAGWSNQVEAVMAWSVRAKSAVTRSQLIGFAHMVPREAIGAHCFIVTEGAPAAHPSHGLPRLSLEVDDAGEGLHVSVCFEQGRGDEHDHHALDLLLGHLAALWRTVLRQETLEQAAGHDALTGLPNRRAFEAELRRRVALSKRRGLGFTLAIVDLDHFKQVNDSFGHPEGDAVLRRSGEAIRASLRSSDRVFRYGGEEFALILETADEGGIADLLERAREGVKALGVAPTPDRRMSASIGWAVFPEDADDRNDLVAEADTALYQAKEGGRDQVIRAGRHQRLAS